MNSVLVIYTSRQGRSAGAGVGGSFLGVRYPGGSTKNRRSRILEQSLLGLWDFDPFRIAVSLVVYSLNQVHRRV